VVLLIIGVFLVRRPAGRSQPEPGGGGALPRSSAGPRNWASTPRRRITTDPPGAHTASPPSV